MYIYIYIWRLPGTGNDGGNSEFGSPNRSCWRQKAWRYFLHIIYPREALQSETQFWQLTIFRNRLQSCWNNTSGVCLGTTIDFKKKCIERRRCQQNGQQNGLRCETPLLKKCIEFLRLTSWPSPSCHAMWRYRPLQLDSRWFRFIEDLWGQNV